MKSASELLAANGSRENWIPLLEVAAREVFELMLSCQLTVPATAEETAPLDITAMVGLAGQLCGVLSVQCEGKAAALMASKMLGTEPEKLGREALDALGELCNMVAGNFKNKIAGLAEGCMLSPPTIITGRDYRLRSVADANALQISLLFEGMPVVISLRIHC
jgi:chemotaxis protein CheX